MSTSFIYIDSLLLSPLNDTPGDIVDDVISASRLAENDIGGFYICWSEIDQQSKPIYCKVFMGNTY